MCPVVSGGIILEQQDSVLSPVHHGTHAWPLVASMFLCQSSGIGHSSGCFFMCLGSRPYELGWAGTSSWAAGLLHPADSCIQQLHPVASRQVRLVMAVSPGPVEISHPCAVVVVVIMWWLWNGREVYPRVRVRTC